MQFTSEEEKRKGREEDVGGRLLHVLVIFCCDPCVDRSSGLEFGHGQAPIGSHTCVWACACVASVSVCVRVCFIGHQAISENSIVLGGRSVRLCSVILFVLTALGGD